MGGDIPPLTGGGGGGGIGGGGGLRGDHRMLGVTRRDSGNER